VGDPIGPARDDDLQLVEREEILEVGEAVRIARTPRLVFRQGERAFYEADGITADLALSKMFSFPSIHGNAEAALARPLKSRKQR
jgi:hypothetical protein